VKHKITRKRTFRIIAGSVTSGTRESPNRDQHEYEFIKPICENYCCLPPETLLHLFSQYSAVVRGVLRSFKSLYINSEAQNIHLALYLFTPV
jgi:hypothetical protein